MKKIPVIIILSLLLFVALSSSVSAVTWWPLVPCGTSVNPAECTRCDLFRLFKNIIDFVLMGLMPPVAAILFVWGGFLILMGGANPGWITQGRTIFWNTFMGVLIISSSWLITNTIIKSLADESVTNPNAPWYQFECRETVAQQPPVQPPAPGPAPQPGPDQPPAPQPGPGQPPAPQPPPAPIPQPNAPLSITTASLPGGTLNQSYSQQVQASGGTGVLSWSISSGTLASGLTLNPATGRISGILTGTITGTSTFTVKVEDSSSPKQSATRSLSIVVTGTGTSALSITTASLPGGTLNQSYSQQVQASGGTTPYSWSKISGTLPTGLSISTNGTISGTLSGTITGNANFSVRVTDNSTPQQSATKQFTIVVAGIGTGAVACLQSNLNLCQPQSTSCRASACSQYVSAINQYAGRTGITNGANLIKSIMMKESACDVEEVSFDGSSFGLMQFRPSTANIYKSRCGVAANITRAWLTNPANANASICIAAEYIKALSQTSCGNSARSIAAGYNGGSGACNNSVDCAGENSCAGGPKKRWECLYEDAQHTVCNGGSDPLDGYNETRNYATKVLYCYNNPGF